MKRKWMKGIGILLAATIFCCGCQTAEKTEKTEKTHLTLWHYWDIKKNQENLQKLVDGFNSSQDSVEVDVTYVPDEDFKKQMALALVRKLVQDLEQQHLAGFWQQDIMTEHWLYSQHQQSLQSRACSCICHL